MAGSITGRKTLWRALRASGLLAGLGFMVWLLIHLLTDPKLLERQLSIAGVMEAIIIGILANATIAFAFSDMVAKSAPGISFGKRMSAYYYAQIAKYVPGRIAALMVQRSILSGPSATVATITSNLELMVISSWLCGGAALALLVWPRNHAGAVILVLAVVLSGAWLLRTDWWHAALQLLMARRAENRLLVQPSRSQKTSRIHAGILCLAMLGLPAASSYILVLNGLGVSHDTALQLTALLLLSWIGGILAFVFPAGIGVREFIFIALGGAILQTPEAAMMAAIALASRVAQVFIDIFGVLLFIVCRRWFMRGEYFHDRQ